MTMNPSYVNNISYIIQLSLPPIYRCHSPSGALQSTAEDPQGAFALLAILHEKGRCADSCYIYLAIVLQATQFHLEKSGSNVRR